MTRWSPCVLVIAVACGILCSVQVLAQSENCPNIGSILSGCGSGDSDCVGDEDDCGGDTAKILSYGNFECGDVAGARNCRNSTQYKEACYITFQCEWDDGCDWDIDSGDVHNDWIKTYDACQ